MADDSITKYPLCGYSTRIHSTTLFTYTQKRRIKANKFLDIEVEVDEDEEEEDDDEAGEAGYEEAAADLERQRGGRSGMIVPDTFEEDEAVGAGDERDHRDYERRARDKEEAEAMRIAREYKERHRQRRGTGIGGLQAMSEFAPKSVLMPGVNDPNIWRVKCKVSAAVMALIGCPLSF